MIGWIGLKWYIMCIFGYSLFDVKPGQLEKYNKLCSCTQTVKEIDFRPD